MLHFRKYWIQKGLQHLTRPSWSSKVIGKHDNERIKEHINPC